MYFGSLILRNVWSRKVRTLLTSFAISISIMTVITMGVLTHSLRLTAVSILQTGTADFSIAQRDVSDVLYSSVDEKDLEAVRAIPEIRNAIGVLVAPFRLDADHPFFLRIGIVPDQLESFGVHILSGRPYEEQATDELMLGYRAARELDKDVGSRIHIDQNDYTVVGIFRTGQVFGDSAAMMPLVHVQSVERKPGTVTLGIVQVQEGADIEAVRRKIEHDMPELATVRTQEDFGRVDRNLELLGAANTGVSALALVIGAVTVLNMMILSVFERTREFGVLRAVGWSRRRILGEILGEALVVTMSGAILGVGEGFLVVRMLEGTPELRGVFSPSFSSDVFARALIITFAMAGSGALYPALRAALLRPLVAIRHE